LYVLTKKSTSSGFFIKPGSEIAVMAQKSNVIDPKNILTITIYEYFHSNIKINRLIKLLKTYLKKDKLLILQILNQKI